MMTRLNMKWMTVGLLLFALVLLTGGDRGLAAKPVIGWFSYDEGTALGKEEGKKIFLHFWAEWCSYCTKMAQKTFTDTPVIHYLNTHFIPIRVNFDREKQVVAKFNFRGLPSTWFLTEGGERIGNRPGFIPAKELLPILKYFNTDSYKTMTFKNFLENGN